VEALAAPVLEDARYGGRPIYFSDVVVPAGAETASFDELRGRSWAYNEPASHSGYLVTLYRLHQMGETGRFFGTVEMTGFHQRSIRRVAAGEVDASAIDSQVLAVELRDHPELRERLRVIDTLGPSTIQPLAAASRLPRSVKDEVRAVVVGLGQDPASRGALDAGLVRSFTPVDDATYADIRAMLAAVEAEGLRF
jgi:phosphonate transport system substrate-binding protein